MKTRCTFSGCDQEAHAKGLCNRHYQQAWRTGNPTIVRPNPHGTPEQRFWRYVQVASEDCCWPWIGFRDKDGYGTLRVGRSTVRAHRFSYELHVGPIPAATLVRHRCNNPCCVNPGHLRLGDHDENMRDRQEAGHYARGEHHPVAKFSDETVQAVRAAVGTYAEIGAQFGMSPSQVGNIRRGDQRTQSLEAAE